MDDRELAMKILQVIMDDMGSMSAKKLIPAEVEEIVETPAEENAETATEEAQEIESGVDEGALPRWKQRMKDRIAR